MKSGIYCLFYGLLTLLMFFTAACTSKKDTSQPRTMLVGTDAAYAPFESEGPNKELKGFDIEILTAIAAKEGIPIKFINTPWEGLFTQLVNGDRDILISAITINEARKQQMDFSSPYFEAVQLIVVPMKSKVQKMEDLKGLKVGVQTGTTGDDVVSALLGKTNANIKRFEGTPLAIKELENGGVDAVVADNGVINNFIANNKVSFKIVSDKSFSKENYGIAVKKGNVELLGKINKGLEAIKADGTYQRIYNGYFEGKK
ncbi:basic amino acid ABC transporter substrate-binding protein [Bdellovibrio svalbardensis]|uniref:Basic amino acid ABC transporter substrate-binding protein n=2 Tax=Bdellovibrio svalbardensis TaxID=2972972 RepID=A0ABT6DHC4_9BACT|nr:basic amino acid ABC transporter substrate-binding protein [Bdellovibrio svalbardensis]MDG0816240.1 basic amino acid ABC transporter substrate-binding protein [Bdellovibrio svalbardensis]